MATSYMDSSAFVKYYSEEGIEKGAEKVKDIIDKAKDGKGTLLSSVLLIGEVVSAFDKWLRLKVLTNDQTVAVIREFISDMKILADRKAIVLEDINSITIASAIDFIVNHHLTANDALHLYAALVNKDRIEQFISSDKSLNAAAKKEGLNIFDPEE